MASDYASNCRTLDYSSPDLAQMCQKSQYFLSEGEPEVRWYKRCQNRCHEGEVAQGVHAQNRGRKGRERLAARLRQSACVQQEDELAVVRPPGLVFDCFEVIRVSRPDDQSKLNTFDGGDLETISLNAQQFLLC